MADKRMKSPSSSAGIVRYDDDDRSIIKLKPLHVAGIIVGLLVLEILLMFVPV